MAVPVQHTAIFGCDSGHGWTETHYRLASTNPETLAPYATDFISIMQQYRVPLLGKDTKLEGVRVSYRDATGDHVSFPYWFTPAKRGLLDKASAAPNLAAKVRFGSVDGKHFSDTYLRGFWDSVEQDEQLDFDTADGANWLTRLQSYRTALQALSYGFLGKDSAASTEMTITGYTQPEGDTRLHFTYANVAGAALVVGQRLTVLIHGLNGGGTFLDGQYRVVVEAGNILRTIDPVAYTPFRSEGKARVRGVQFYAYAGFTYVKLATRKPGRPIGRAPGRLKGKTRA